MKNLGSTNAPWRPTVEGQFALFRNPRSFDSWLLDIAERDSRGNLTWRAVNDERLLAVAQAGYHYSAPGGVGDPYVRTSVLRQYAVNLMLRHATSNQGWPSSPTDLSAHAAATAQLLLVDQQGAKLIPFAIANGLEADTPHLAEIEQMLCICERTKHHAGPLSGAVPVLQSLRDGLDPSGRLHDCRGQLVSLMLAHPALQVVSLSEVDNASVHSYSPPLEVR